MACVHALPRRRLFLLEQQTRRNAQRVALRSGHRNWTFCSSDNGGHRTAAMFSLIETGKLDDVYARA
jgi:transposase